LCDPLTGIALCVILGITGFWCLSKLALVYYLLPTTPFVCAFIADILVKDGWTSQPRFMRRLVIAAYVMPLGAVLGLGVSTFVGVYTTPQCPGVLFKQLRNDPALAGKDFYFGGREAPYSAEFYLGDRVRQHTPESVEESVRKSADALFLIRRDRIPRKEGVPREEVIPRKLMMKKGHWLVYGPEED